MIDWKKEEMIDWLMNYCSRRHLGLCAAQYFIFVLIFTRVGFRAKKWTRKEAQQIDYYFAKKWSDKVKSRQCVRLQTFLQTGKVFKIERSGTNMKFAPLLGVRVRLKTLHQKKEVLQGWSRVFNTDVPEIIISFVDHGVYLFWVSNLMMVSQYFSVSK